MKQWNEAFKKDGRIFFDPQEDMAEIVRVFKKNKVKRVLDLGSGTGRHLVYLAKKGFDVYGIDIADEGIKLSRKWLKAENLKANLKVGSIHERLPYKNNFFDAVISTQAFHHERIKKVRKGIQEIERVLKPGGMVFMTFFRRILKSSVPGTIIKKRKWQKADYMIIEPRTYVPIEGYEKGLAHYIFNKREIKKEFHSFKIHDTWVDSNKRHICFLGELKQYLPNAKC
ncbi:MAG: class I SAM-dependent methyltransferase [Parcubacteria group bacterium]|jgi:SAM-dependent methyltransferase